MSLNTSNTPDGRGVLLYNGERLLCYSKDVTLSFSHGRSPAFKGSKQGRLYLTSHRIIFTNKEARDTLHSFSMPFHVVRQCTLEQPILGANYLKGVALAQPGGNWEGQVDWKLTFSKGGCIDFGRALLSAVDMASRYRPYDAPPPYAPPAGGYFAAPPSYFAAPPPGTYQGFQAPPPNAFPDQPQAGEVFMYEAPPPYGGIGPDPPPYPANGPVMPMPGAPQTQQSPQASAPPPSYEQASAIPTKS